MRIAPFAMLAALLLATPALAIEGLPTCGALAVSGADVALVTDRLAVELPAEGVEIAGVTPEYLATEFHHDLACLLLGSGLDSSAVAAMTPAEVVVHANDVLSSNWRSRADALLAILQAMKQARPELVLVGPPLQVK